MAEDEPKSSKRVLDPVERSSEVLFGLIMVLGFTSSMSAADAGRPQVRTMIIGALGCNLAWGIVDALMYLMAALSEKRHGLATLKAVVSAPAPDAAYTLIREHLPPIIAGLMTHVQFEEIRRGLVKLPHVSRSVRLTLDDWRGAVGVFLLVFLSTFPVVVPFLLTSNAHRALRISNLIAIIMLAMTGYSYGRYSGERKWEWSAAMVFLGGAMVALTVALGG
jgi:VIT1/CCC1 family predicted Fe2+/Mn2+ transporter